MAKFLSTRATSAQIEQIISCATKYLVLVSPFIKLHHALLQLIKEAEERRVRIIVAYGKTELDSEMKSQLKKIPTLELYFIQNLHAKCYFNEKSMILSSMNLYDFSEVNNWEMGILIDKENDRELYDAASSEVRRILKSMAKTATDAFDGITDSHRSEALDNAVSIPEMIQDWRKKFKKTLVELAPGGGFCIRCGQKIPTDSDKPFCKTCYYRWLEYENYDYLEKRCHLCGKPTQTTIEYPLCASCFNRIASKLTGK